MLALRLSMTEAALLNIVKNHPELVDIEVGRRLVVFGDQRRGTFLGDLQMPTFG